MIFVFVTNNNNIWMKVMELDTIGWMNNFPLKVANVTRAGCEKASTGQFELLRWSTSSKLFVYIIWISGESLINISTLHVLYMVIFAQSAWARLIRESVPRQKSTGERLLEDFHAIKLVINLSYVNTSYFINLNDWQGWDSALTHSSLLGQGHWDAVCYESLEESNTEGLCHSE